ncbi:hypothetical protein SAMN02927900_04872 [Rhizobium mongolense subsp. loessense]|uniref:Uncharacterized protein n=1 Tax=Rhizobium mongolense subsp. loessense TaxID=158890 RepID=A0A1G4T8U7_9HYPH|nr:hypothetical protein SAMN02927900_04872 [Rhizobium mongolense subsp. loessense]
MAGVEVTVKRVPDLAREEKAPIATVAELADYNVIIVARLITCSVAWPQEGAFVHFLLILTEAPVTRRQSRPLPVKLQGYDQQHGPCKHAPEQTRSSCFVKLETPRPFSTPIVNHRLTPTRQAYTHRGTVTRASAKAPSSPAAFQTPA